MFVLLFVRLFVVLFVCLFVILFVCLLFCLSVCYFVCLFGLRCHFSFLSAALKKRVHGKQVKKKKRENLLQTSTWTSLETYWTESRTSKFMHFTAVVNTNKYTLGNFICYLIIGDEIIAVTFTFSWINWCLRWMKHRSGWGWIGYLWARQRGIEHLYDANNRKEYVCKRQVFFIRSNEQSKVCLGNIYDRHWPPGDKRIGA